MDVGGAEWVAVERLEQLASGAYWKLVILMSDDQRFDVPSVGSE